MDFKIYNEFRKYGHVADFYKKGENVKSGVMCMLLNGKSLEGVKEKNGR